MTTLLLLLLLTKEGGTVVVKAVVTDDEAPKANKTATTVLEESWNIVDERVLVASCKPSSDFEKGSMDIVAWSVEAKGGSTC